MTFYCAFHSFVNMLKTQDSVLQLSHLCVVRDNPFMLVFWCIKTTLRRVNIVLSEAHAFARDGWHFACRFGVLCVEFLGRRNLSFRNYFEAFTKYCNITFNTCILSFLPNWNAHHPFFSIHSIFNFKHTFCKTVNTTLLYTQYVSLYHTSSKSINIGLYIAIFCQMLFHTYYYFYFFPNTHCFVVWKM